MYVVVSLLPHRSSTVQRKCGMCRGGTVVYTIIYEEDLLTNLSYHWGGYNHHFFFRAIVFFQNKYIIFTGVVLFWSKKTLSIVNSERRKYSTTHKTKTPRIISNIHPSWCTTSNFEVLLLYCITYTSHHHPHSHTSYAK